MHLEEGEGLGTRLDPCIDKAEKKYVGIQNAPINTTLVRMCSEGYCSRFVCVCVCVCVCMCVCVCVCVCLHLFSNYKW